MPVSFGYKPILAGNDLILYHVFSCNCHALPRRPLSRRFVYVERWLTRELGDYKESHGNPRWLVFFPLKLRLSMADTTDFLE
jgi:hypothetical protein